MTWSMRTPAAILRRPAELLGRDDLGEQRRELDADRVDDVVGDAERVEGPHEMVDGPVEVLGADAQRRVDRLHVAAAVDLGAAEGGDEEGADVLAVAAH